MADLAWTLIAVPTAATLCLVWGALKGRLPTSWKAFASGDETGWDLLALAAVGSPALATLALLDGPAPLILAAAAAILALGTWVLYAACFALSKARVPRGSFAAATP
ncbi:MAG: hypothetical protein ACYDBQ_10385 [Thermoplasmatota archaeon]